MWSRLLATRLLTFSPRPPPLPRVAALWSCGLTLPGDRSIDNRPLTPLDDRSNRSTHGQRLSQCWKAASVLEVQYYTAILPPCWLFFITAVITGK